MKSKEEIKTLLEDFGKAWPEDSSVVKGVMRKIESTPARPNLSNRRRIAMKSLIGIAACLVLGTIMWLVPFFSLTPAVTLAQVQAAIAKQKWMHVKYDNGKESWTTLDAEKVYIKNSNGSIEFVDRSKNLYMSYSPEFGIIDKIQQEDESQKWTPETPAEIVGFDMDMPEGEATAKQKENPRYGERHNDRMNGRQRVRFDQYYRDALGQYLLVRQLWVDPQTYLPVRIKSLVRAEQNNRQELKYAIGEYNFPAQGPESIYDLGISREVPVTQENRKKPEDVSKVIDLIRQARERFTVSYRLIVWPNDNSEIDVIYQNGAPAYKQSHDDWNGVHFRRDRYFNLEEKYPRYHLSMPATADQVSEWTRTQTPVEIYMLDGKRYFEKHGPFSTPFYKESNNRQTRLSVKMLLRDGLPSPPDTPIQNHWPLTNLAGGSFIFQEEGENTMPGAIVIRHIFGNIRYDYYLDTARDYICIKWVWWKKKSDKWDKDGEEMLLDLKQLSEGQWYATKKYMKSYGSSERKTSPYEKTWNLDFKILEEKEFPPDIFNGEKILEDAKREGAVIETY